jgi:hypothetical protein
MIEADVYVRAVIARIERARGQIRQTRVGPLDAVVGDFYEGSVIAQGHIHFTAVVAPLVEVTAHAVTDFTQHAAQLAIRTTLPVPGGRTEIITFAGLVSHRVRPDAVAAAVAKPPLLAVGTSRPVVVDLSTGLVHSFTGTRFIGWALQDMIKAKVRELFPLPAEVADPRFR